MKYIYLVLAFFCYSVSFAQFTKLNNGSSIILGDDQANSAAIADFDGDDILDIVVARAGSLSSIMYQGDGSFNFTKNPTETSAISLLNARCWSASYPDYDNDGDLDLFLTSSEAKALLLRNESGTFVSIDPSTVDFLDETDTHERFAVWLDYNQDGHLDLYIARANFQDDYLYINQGNNQNYDLIMIPSDGNLKDGTWADFDKDGDLDLFITSIQADDAYFENVSGSLSTSNTNHNTLKDNQNSSSSSFGDYDNDGDLDVFVTTNSTTEPNAFFRNDDGVFVEVTDLNITNEQALSTASIWADFNNDGYLDLFVVNTKTYSADEKPNELFYNNGNGDFTKVTTGTMVDETIANTSVSIGDMNNDGFVDIFLPVIDEFDWNDRNQVYVNDAIAAGNTNNWIGLKLKGTLSNKFGIGAQVYLDSDNLNQYRELQPSSAVGGQNDYRLNFGLGTDTNPKVRILWPSGVYQVINSLSENSYHEITEPSDPTITIVNDNKGASGLLTGIGQQILYQFELRTTVSGTISNLEVNASGTFQSSDFESNGIKLWYSNEDYFVNATEITQLPVGTNFTFSSINQNLIRSSPENSNYFWITADVSTTASNGNTIKVAPIFDTNQFSGFTAFVDESQTGDEYTIQTIDPTDFPEGYWRAYAYEGLIMNESAVVAFLGFYDENQLDFDIRDILPSTTSSTLSDAPNYIGQTVPYDGHSVSFKRKNFDCGLYQFDFDFYDDRYELYVDGVLVDSVTTHSYIPLINAWTGPLGPDSEVEIRYQDAFSGSGIAVNLTKMGDITLVSPDVTICAGVSKKLTAHIPEASPNTTYTWEIPAALTADKTTGESIMLYSNNALGDITPVGDYMITCTANMAGCTVQKDIKVTINNFFPCPSDLRLKSLNVNTPTLLRGIDTQILYKFRVKAEVADVFLSNLELHAHGTFQNTDFENSSVKLWYSHHDFLPTATELAQTSIASNFTFSSLNVSLPPTDNYYFWVTADVSNVASVGNTIELKAILSSETFSGIETFIDEVEFGDIYTIEQPPSPTNFPDNFWRVSAYEGQLLSDFGSVSYYGFYEDTEISINSRDYWSLTPSNAPPYTGALIDTSLHSVSYKRRGFPCGMYRLSASHEGTFKLYIDGVEVNSGTVHGEDVEVWTGFLGATNEIQIDGEKTGSRCWVAMEFLDIGSTLEFVTESDATVAKGGNTSLSISSPPSPTSTYAWDIPVGFTPSSTTGDNINITAATDLAEGDYTVSCTATDPHTGCTLTNDILVTVVSPPINLDLRSFTFNQDTIFIATEDNIIYQAKFELTDALPTVSFEALSFSTNGDFTTSDLTNFKFWHNTEDNLETATVLSTQTNINTGEELNFSNLNIDFAQTEHFFWVTADVSSEAIHTVQLQLLNVTSEDFVFLNDDNTPNGNINITGSFSDGILLTVIDPSIIDIHLHSFAFQEDELSINSQNNLAYKIQLDLEENPSNIKLVSLSFPTADNFAATDIDSLKLWYHTEDNFEAASLLSTQEGIDSGQDLNFDNLHLDMAPSHLFFWLTVDISRNAVDGSLIQFNPPTDNQVVFSYTVNKFNNLSEQSRLRIRGEMSSEFYDSEPLGDNQLFFPTAFTPNADGFNDQFVIHAPGAIAVSLNIWDRFGALVYQTSNIEELRAIGWNGGNEPTGVFVWKMTLKDNSGKEIQQNGEVKLIR